MAIRTTELAVAGIAEVDPLISVTPFIEVASNLVDDLLTDTPPGYSATKLELIERWLSAHFYHIRDKAVASEQAGSVNQSFQFRLGLNLAVTMYGQQAMMIDTAGLLAAASKRAELGLNPTVGVVHLGTTNPAGDDITI